MEKYVNEWHDAVSRCLSKRRKIWEKKLL
jgi:hypothetical protein